VGRRAMSSWALETSIPTNTCGSLLAVPPPPPSLVRCGLRRSWQLFGLWQGGTSRPGLTLGLSRPEGRRPVTSRVTRSDISIFTYSRYGISIQGAAHVQPGDHRCHHWSGRGRPIKRRDQGVKPMRSCAFQDAASEPDTSAGCRLIPSVSREAAGSPTPLLTQERTCPEQRRYRVSTCHRRHVPMSGPGPSRLCPGHVFALGERETSGPPDYCAGTGRRLRRTPM
jgi:hypothetical protein